MDQCIDCGQEFENKGSRRKPYCLDCAFKRMREAAKQMAAREGPYYEKWLLAKDKAVKNYRVGVEKAVKHYEQSLDQLCDMATPEGQAELIIRMGNLYNALEE